MQLLRRILRIAVVTLVMALLAALPASADEYESEYAGHPLRMIAYAVHPLGVLVEYLVLRPFHWVGNHEPFATIFGHEID